MNQESMGVQAISCPTRRAFVLTAASLAHLPLWAAANEESAIRTVLMAQFDKPEARLQVEPVVVMGDAAVASWAQQNRGGRALLRRRHEQWRIVACAGDAFKDAKLLQDAGLSAADARALVKTLTAAEAKLAAA